MMRIGFGLIAIAVLLAGCQPAPIDPPDAPVEQTPEESAEESSPPDGSETGTARTGFQPAATPVFCSEFDPGNLEWFELGLGGPRDLVSSEGSELSVQRASLPSTDSERYNTIAEICPGFHLVSTHVGDTKILSVDEGRFADTANLTPAGSLNNPADAGVIGGGPTWGFRDSLVAGDYLYLSDAVLDVEQQCVSVAIHRVAVEEVLTVDDATTDVIYTSTPCVSYTDDYRARAPLKVHLGGALAYRGSSDELYLTIGDMHLGSSTIGQAEAIGVDNVEKDYALLRDDTAAISAVVAISDPAQSAQSRVFAKGLRNSLGITVVRTDRLWLTDHGPQGGDELNLIEEGADYGWPLTSEGQPYDRSNYPDDPNSLPAPWLDIYLSQQEGTVDPATSWSPAIAPTAIIQYPEGATGIANWAGDLLIGSLRGQALIRLALTPESTITEDRVELGERIRDMVVTPGGQILAVTDSSRLLVVSG
ncbi:aldose dehydrogenase [Pontimonas salivibrio]|uniref:Aldose dehydrogenase n=1 Tax=Pontimonas salivibrio TaxID=1159327 RepID=A0A2L2BNJ8_9MICO|nr:PQQ-dependent sugar dehydrogenase [Pontimonas salivibrio]AVG23245.1 aldose dehydrogenase [Pontimonas salivibrio]